MTGEERDKIEEEGKFFLATRLVQAGRQQEAIQALAELKSPEASFQRAMVSMLYVVLCIIVKKYYICLGIEILSLESIKTHGNQWISLKTSHIFQLYKEQAQAVLNDSSADGSSSGARSQQITLLTQARDTLYLTLDRLRMPGTLSLSFLSC